MDEVQFEEWSDDDPWWADLPDDDERNAAEMRTDPGFTMSAAELLAEAELAGPGGSAQQLLASLASRELSRDQWLTAVQLWEAQEAWLAGQKALAVLGFAGPTPVSVAGFRDDEALTLELAMGIGCSDAFAYDQIAQARLLSSTLSATGDLLRAGRLSPYRARLIATELGPLHPEVAQQVEATVLDTAGQVPTGLLRKRLARQAKRLDPQTTNDRKVAELAEKTPGRRVVFDPDAGDGLMGMYAYLPPVEALAMRAALKSAAGTFRTADGRGQDAREADALIGMVLGFDPERPGRPVTPKVKVGVLIDLPTLLGLRDNGGELLGYGHLPTEVARELADHASWQRLVYDPVTGYLLDAGTTVHDMPALSEFIALRDRRDRYPGGTRTHPLDLDHTVPFKPQPPRGGQAPAEVTECGPGLSAHRAASADAPGAADAPRAVEDGEPLEPAEQAADAEPADPPEPVETDDAYEAETVEEVEQSGETLAGPNSSPHTEACSTPTVGATLGIPAGAATLGIPAGPASDEAEPRSLPGDTSGAHHEGGRTSADNLAALSRRHHRAKTFLGFSYRQLGLGVLEWTTPLGRTYRTYPYDYRPEDWQPHAGQHAEGPASHCADDSDSDRPP
jgi:hypothetical protein